jgi:hypothetical protein
LKRRRWGSWPDHVVPVREEVEELSEKLDSNWWRRKMRRIYDNRRKRMGRESRRICPRRELGPGFNSQLGQFCFFVPFVGLHGE